MKYTFTSIKLILFSIYIYLFCVPKSANAYLDPGTGSYVFQLLIAGLLGSTFFLKSTIKRIKEIFGKEKEKIEIKKDLKVNEKQ